MSKNAKICLEYVWIDGNNELRSKIKIIRSDELFPGDNVSILTKATQPQFWEQLSHNFSSSSYSSSCKHNLKLENIPIWNFDGSSTRQATGHESDIILRPINVYDNPFFPETKINGVPLSSYLVLCECYNKDYSAHVTNTRFNCVATSTKMANFECLFGIEQEYVIFERTQPAVSEKEKDKEYVMFEEIVSGHARAHASAADSRDNNNDVNDNDIDIDNAAPGSEKGCVPYKWISKNEPGKGPQGPYYCSVGGDRNFGRQIVDEHMLLCLKAGIEICGTNSEVMASQWEFQIGTCDVLKVCDDLIMARYILHKVTEKYNCWVSFHPKPRKGDWNGSGAHTNFSTKDMRHPGGLKYVIEACEKMRAAHSNHIEVYGADNNMRLTGAHETCAITDYSWGIGNRGCSVRIPLHVFHNDCGYLEDRRPASNCDPYLVTHTIMTTICE